MTTLAQKVRTPRKPRATKPKLTVVPDPRTYPVEHPDPRPEDLTPPMPSNVEDLIVQHFASNVDDLIAEADRLDELEAEIVDVADEKRLADLAKIRAVDPNERHYNGKDERRIALYTDEWLAIAERQPINWRRNLILNKLNRRIEDHGNGYSAYDKAGRVILYVPVDLVVHISPRTALSIEDWTYLVWQDMNKLLAVFHNNPPIDGIETPDVDETWFEQMRAFERQRRGDSAPEREAVAA